MSGSQIRDMDEDDLPGAPETVPPPPPFRKGDVVRTVAHGVAVVVAIVWNEYTWDLHCDGEDGTGVYSPESVTLANDDPEAVAQADEFRLRRQQEWDADSQSKWVR